jgi:dCTP diphosphatase
MLSGVSDLIELRDGMREFTNARDWEQFHDPKSLVLALVGEVGELAELFQWVPAEDATARAQTEPLRTRAGEEMADVLLYLVRLADVLGIDLHEVARLKLGAASARFPADDVRGIAPKRR